MSRPHSLDGRFCKPGDENRRAPNVTREADVRQAFKDNPWQQGEGAVKYYQRIAAIVGCSKECVSIWYRRIEDERLGKLRIEQEREQADLLPMVMPETLGPIQTFRGWRVEFTRIRTLAILYQDLARSQGCPYAAAFCDEVALICDRAARRACMDKVHG